MSLRSSPVTVSLERGNRCPLSPVRRGAFLDLVDRVIFAAACDRLATACHRQDDTGRSDEPEHCHEHERAWGVWGPSWLPDG